MNFHDEQAITMMMRDALVGQEIADVYVDSHVTYIMLANGTQVSISGAVVVDVSNAKDEGKTHE